MNTKYIAEFRTVEVSDEKNELEKDINQEEITKKTRKIDAKTVGKIGTTIVATTVVASQLYSRYQSASNSITGNSVAQRTLDNRMSYLNEGLSGAGSIVIGALVGGVPGLIAGGSAYATRTAMNAFNVAQENKLKIAHWNIESLVNSEKQNRLVKDITGIRI